MKQLSLASVIEESSDAGATEVLLDITNRVVRWPDLWCSLGAAI